MADLKFDKEITALLVIDPYNDFIKVPSVNRQQAVASPLVSTLSPFECHEIPQ